LKQDVAWRVGRKLFDYLELESVKSVFVVVFLEFGVRVLVVAEGGLVLIAAFLIRRCLSNVRLPSFGILDFVNRCWLVFAVLLDALLFLFRVFFVVLRHGLLLARFTPILKPIFHGFILMKLRTRLLFLTLATSLQIFCAHNLSQQSPLSSYRTSCRKSPVGIILRDDHIGAIDVNDVNARINAPNPDARDY